MNRFLKKAGAKKKPRFHSTILSVEFAPSVEDCSKDEETAKAFKYTRPQITYAVVKFAKYTQDT